MIQLELLLIIRWHQVVSSVSGGYLVPIAGIRNQISVYTDTIELLPIQHPTVNTFNNGTNGHNIQPLSSTGNELDNQQPDWSLNYQSESDNRSGVSFSTNDLISWSFQIVRGMNYLASKKVRSHI